MEYQLIESCLTSGGRAQEKGVSENDVDAEQLAIGIEIEKEHTDNPEVAKKIAIDHLAEIPDYYTRLRDMESQATNENYNLMKEIISKIHEH